MDEQAPNTATDPAFLADEADLDVLVAGVRQTPEIAAQVPLAGYIAGEDAPSEQG